MKIRNQLQSIQKQLQQSTKAFKKNKQNLNVVNFPTTINGKQDLNNTKLLLKSNMNSLLKNKSSSSQNYQLVIKNLKLLLKSILTKNQFLIYDRSQVLKQNQQLKKQLQNKNMELEQLKKKVVQLKMTGYSGNQVNGVFQDGKIFAFCYDQPSRLITQKQSYSVQSQNQKAQQSQNQSQQSLLIRQVSQQMMKQMPHQNILSPAPQSQTSSQINQTPNYNFKDNGFELQNLGSMKHHFVDVQSGLISYDNSAGQSGQNYARNKNAQVQISLNNMNNQLYLPINLNKVILKQQIQTFKGHLRNLNESGNQCSNQSNVYCKQSNQKLQQSGTQNIYNSDNQDNPQRFTSCSSQCQEGIFRSFYLSIFQYPLYRQKFLQLLQELQHDDSYMLYNLYPKNDFWIQIVFNFLAYLEHNKTSAQQMLQHINSHKLIDILIIQALKYRVEFLYKDQCEQSIQDSALLNITNSQDQGFNTNRQSCVNGSIQNIGQSVDRNIQQSTHIVQILNALSNLFDLECRKQQKTFSFFQSSSLNQSSINSRMTNGQRPLFRIFNDEGTNLFVFNFTLFYSRQSQTPSNKFNGSVQRHEFQNSIKRQFQDIDLNPHSQHSNNQSQNYSQRQNSKNQNYINQYQDSSQQNQSFVSQTCQYQSQQGQYYDDQSSKQYDQNTKCVVSQNISYQVYDSKETTQRSLNLSNLNLNLDNSFKTKGNQRYKQLRQRNCNYNMQDYDYSHPIREELIQTQSKQVFNIKNLGDYSQQTSFGPSVSQSKNVSRQASRVKRVNDEKPIKLKEKQNKGKHSYQDIYSEDFIMRRIKSTGSDEDDQNVNYQERSNEKWQFNNKIR